MMTTQSIGGYDIMSGSMHSLMISAFEVSCNWKKYARNDDWFFDLRMKFLINKYVDMLIRMLVLLIFDFGYECYSPLSTIYDYIVAVSSISEGHRSTR